MVRPKREKDKKYRVNITLDESVILEIGNYIDNLSGYINAVLKKYIANRKELEKTKNATNKSDSHNDLLCYKNKKSTYANNNANAYEPLDDNLKWW